jgi:signal transduction histidine kinase
MWNRILSFFKNKNASEGPGGTGALGESALEAMLRDFPDAAVVYDTNFNVLSFNRAAEALFGIRSEELRGVRIDPGAVERPHWRLLAQTLFPSLAPSSVERSEPGVSPQIVSLTFEDPHRELLTYTLRIDGAARVPTAFVKIVRDETRTKGVLTSQSEFVSIAAHQLRTPLTALRWSLESLATGKETDTGTLFKESLALVDRCLKIVNDFLDAAKIEEGKFGFEYQQTDLVALLETLATTIAPIAKQYEVEIFLNHDGIPSLPLSVDPTRLSTAILNHLDNGVRYNVKGGKVTITVSKDPAHAMITIADTGIGIPRGEERKLFQKLERGSNAIQVEPNGSGLGLYIAKNIVEGHGGTVTFTSEAERGTSFTVTLPLERGRA